MKIYELSTTWQGFPYGVQDFQNFANNAVEAQMTFLHLAANDFDPATDCIITGCEHISGQKVTAGLVYIGGNIVLVPETITALTTGNVAFRKAILNPEAILWGDAQSRDSIYEYIIAIEQLTFSQGQIDLAGLPRLHRRLAIDLQPNWQVHGPLSFDVDVFKGTAELKGDVQWTGPFNNTGAIQIGTLPDGSRPFHAIVKPVCKAGSTGGEVFSVAILANGTIQLNGGEVDTNDVICLDGLRWTIFSV